MVQSAAIRQRIEAFTSELEALIRVEIRRGFETALGIAAPVRARSRSAGRPRAPSAPAKTNAMFSSPGRKKGEKRTPEQLAALKEALLAAITETPGQRVEEIGRSMEMPTNDLKRPLGQLVDAKNVKTTGIKRATRYFPAK